MKTNHYPTKQELGQKWWYRLGIVFKWLIIVSALISSSFITGGLWYLDGVISAVIWYFLLMGLGAVIRYVVYGKAPNTPEIKKEKFAKKNELIGLFIILIVYSLLVWGILSQQ